MARRFTFNRKLKEEKEYWVDRLSSVRGLAHLKPDQSAPAADRDKFTFTFSPDLLPKLVKLTGDSQLLLYAAMLGALKVCLYTYTENKQIVVGSPPRLKDSDAPPVPNALAIIDQVDSSMSFRQLLLQVRETLLAAYAHQTFPFEQLISSIEIEH